MYHTDTPYCIFTVNVQLWGGKTWQNWVWARKYAQADGGNIPMSPLQWRLSILLSCWTCADQRPSSLSRHAAKGSCSWARAEVQQGRPHRRGGTLKQQGALWPLALGEGKKQVAEKCTGSYCWWKTDAQEPLTSGQEGQWMLWGRLNSFFKKKKAESINVCHIRVLGR